MRFGWEGRGVSMLLGRWSEWGGEEVKGDGVGDGDRKK